jgi:hypothetical protein
MTFWFDWNIVGDQIAHWNLSVFCSFLVVIKLYMLSKLWHKDSRFAMVPGATHIAMGTPSPAVVKKSNLEADSTSTGSVTIPLFH